MWLSDKILYAFCWVIPRRLNFICRCFGTHCLFHLHRRVGGCRHTYPPMKMEKCVPKRRHIKFRRRGIAPKKSIQHRIFIFWRVMATIYIYTTPSLYCTLSTLCEQPKSNYNTETIKKACVTQLRAPLLSASFKMDGNFLCGNTAFWRFCKGLWQRLIHY